LWGGAANVLLLFQQQKKMPEKNLVKEPSEMFGEIAETKRINKFYEAFSKNLKLGIRRASGSCGELALPRGAQEARP